MRLPSYTPRKDTHPFICTKYHTTLNSMLDAKDAEDIQVPLGLFPSGDEPKEVVRIG